MSRNSDVFCDSCNKEISKTSLEREYYLSLTSTPKTNNSGVCYSMAMIPLFSGQKDFCGPGCLKKWIEDTFLPGVN